MDYIDPLEVEWDAIPYTFTGITQYFERHSHASHVVRELLLCYAEKLYALLFGEGYVLMPNYQDLSKLSNVELQALIERLTHRLRSSVGGGVI